MNGIETLVSIVRVEGEVMLHNGTSGWVRALAGMVFPPDSDITIKSGSSGRAELINRNGQLVRLGPGSMKIISKDLFDFEVDTLRNFTLTTGEMMSTTHIVRERLLPVA